MDTTLKKKKVLVVEDDRDLIKVIEIGLNVLGYESIVSMDGKQAVRMAAEEKPDLITMDINMPKPGDSVHSSAGAYSKRLF